VLGAGSVQSLGEGAGGALAHAVPGAIVSEVARGALVDASGGGVVAELLSAAVDHAAGVEDVAEGELGGEGAGSNTTLGYILCEIEGAVLHWACGYA